MDVSREIDVTRRRDKRLSGPEAHGGVAGGNPPVMTMTCLTVLSCGIIFRIIGTRSKSTRMIESSAWFAIHTCVRCADIETGSGGVPGL